MYVCMYVCTYVCIDRAEILPVKYNYNTITSHSIREDSPPAVNTVFLGSIRVPIPNDIESFLHRTLINSGEIRKF